MFGARRFQGLFALVAFCTVMAQSSASGGPTVEELKARLASAGPGAKPHLCLQIAERQLAEADKLYAALDDEKARATLTDVVTYSEMARDNAIQSHKYLKQTEIAVRGMVRKVNEILHARAHEDQAALQDALKRLQRVRDDLLIAMFPKAVR
jgi:hypothetical protein